MKISKELMESTLEWIKSMFLQPEMNFTVIDPEVFEKHISEPTDIHPKGSKCVAIAKIRPTVDGIKGVTAMLVIFEGDVNPTFLMNYKLKKSTDKLEFI